MISRSKQAARSGFETELLLAAQNRRNSVRVPVSYRAKLHGRAFRPDSGASRSLDVAGLVCLARLAAAYACKADSDFLDLYLRTVWFRFSGNSPLSTTVCRSSGRCPGCLPRGPSGAGGE